MSGAGRSGGPAAQRSFVYIACAQQGVVVPCVLAPDGTLEAGTPVAAAPMVMPMVASRDGRFLYAASRAQPWQLLCYRIDAATGGLQLLGHSPLPDSMVQLAIDASARWLLAVSYGGHCLSVHAIGADGRVAASPAQHLGSGGRYPPALLCVAGGGVHVPHLGSDEVRAYRLDADAGRLVPQAGATAVLPAGTGPRHAAMSPDRRFAYVLGELDGSVSVWRCGPPGAAWQAVQSVASLPADAGLVPGTARAPAGAGSAGSADTSRAIWCADLQVRPDGRFLYTSERTGSTLSCLEIDPGTGRLALRAVVPTEAQPRSFAIDPSGRWLVAGGERSATVSVHEIDPVHGTLGPRRRVPVCEGASGVLITEPPRPH